MTQQMKGRIGSLLGLAFIIAFGVILSKVKTGEDSGGESPVLFKPESGTIYGDGAGFISRPVSGDKLEMISGAETVREETATVEDDMYMPLADVIERLDRIDASRTIEKEYVDGLPEKQFTYYRVKPGDRLISIAKRKYGENNWRMYRKIRKADGSEIDDPSLLKPGEVLRMPVISGPVGYGREHEKAQAVDTDVPDFSQRNGGGVTEVSMEELRERLAARRDVSPASRRRIYVVREGDNLTSIAREMLGDGGSAAVDRLFEANRDRLYSKDVISPGMKLRIP